MREVVIQQGRYRRDVNASVIGKMLILRSHSRNSDLQKETVMKLTRRQLLATGAGAASAAMLSACQINSGERSKTSPLGGSTSPSIDRKAVVSRHNPRVRAINPYAALTLGNGTFAFTADITGLQTFYDAYQKDFPLCTTAAWAWHTTPAPAGLDLNSYRYKEYNTYGRPVGYATSSTGQTELYNYLRENPHRMHIGRIGLVLKKNDGTEASTSDIAGIDQTLDLWTGVADSRFQVAGVPVRVQTCVHPTMDVLAVRIESPMIREQKLAVRSSFPYPSSEVDMADWKSPEKHTSTCTIGDSRVATIVREIDKDGYLATLGWRAGALKQAGAHAFILHGTGETLEFEMAFNSASSSNTMQKFSDFSETVLASVAHWEKFWTEGGVIDLSESTDPRAPELERRIVLSQYNTALHCAGPMPPQETGLLFNSWYGKSHLEMHWWHGVHCAAWNRLPLFERSLDFYQRIMPVGKATAMRQGYDGVRWPKMVGPDGRDSPSPIAPLLIWQQPHPIYYAELCYRRNPTRKTLAHWQEIVFESAKFMASYTVLDQGRYMLGPPLKTVSENTEQTTTKNPTFELTYWRFGLSTAQLWRKRLGLAPDPRWADVLARLSSLPVDSGRYLFQEGTTDTYTKWSYEHPAILGAYGMQPGAGVDPSIMRNSLKEIMRVWQWDRAWGWDFPMAGLAAAKLGERDIAFDALMIQSPKNLYHPNGHVYQRPKLTAYLPANGGLLAAAAMLAAGSSDAPRKNLGSVIRNGKWAMRSEGITPLL